MGQQSHHYCAHRISCITRWYFFFSCKHLSDQYVFRFFYGNNVTVLMAASLLIISSEILSLLSPLCKTHMHFRRVFPLTLWTMNHTERRKKIILFCSYPYKAKATSFLPMRIQRSLITPSGGEAALICRTPRCLRQPLTHSLSQLNAHESRVRQKWRNEFLFVVFTRHLLQQQNIRGRTRLFHVNSCQKM